LLSVGRVVVFGVMSCASGRAAGPVRSAARVRTGTVRTDRL